MPKFTYKFTFRLIYTTINSLFVSMLFSSFTMEWTCKGWLRWECIIEVVCVYMGKDPDNLLKGNVVCILYFHSSLLMDSFYGCFTVKKQLFLFGKSTECLCSGRLCDLQSFKDQYSQYSLWWLLFVHNTMYVCTHYLYYIFYFKRFRWGPTY